MTSLLNVAVSCEAYLRLLPTLVEDPRLGANSDVPDGENSIKHKVHDSKRL
jgi:hypothetical protein